MSDSNQPPTPSKRPKVSAFAMAREATSVSAEITVEDVMSLTAWPHAQAAAFLNLHSEPLARCMLAAGVGLLHAMVEGRNNAN